MGKELGLNDEAWHAHSPLAFPYGYGRYEMMGSMTVNGWWMEGERWKVRYGLRDGRSVWMEWQE